MAYYLLRKRLPFIKIQHGLFMGGAMHWDLGVHSILLAKSGGAPIEHENAILAVMS